MASYEGVNDILVAHMLTAYVYLSMYFILSLAIASHFSVVLVESQQSYVIQWGGEPTVCFVYITTYTLKVL